MQTVLGEYCTQGGGLFVSGSYIATDLFASRDSSDIKFARQVLHLNYVTHHAAADGRVVVADERFGSRSEIIAFNSAIHPQIYTVEAPDALEPADSLGRIILRYAENQFSAGVAYTSRHRVVALGFPFETILEPRQRENLMQAVLDFVWR